MVAAPGRFRVKRSASVSPPTAFPLAEQPRSRSRAGPLVAMAMEAGRRLPDRMRARADPGAAHLRTSQRRRTADPYSRRRRGCSRTRRTRRTSAARAACIRGIGMPARPPPRAPSATWPRRWGSSSGLLHHDFGSMDGLVAVVFEQAGAHGPAATREPSRERRPRSTSCRFSSRRTAGRSRTWRSSCGWTRGPRPPGDRPCRRCHSGLNVEWQQLSVEVIRAELVSATSAVPTRRPHRGQPGFGGRLFAAHAEHELDLAVGTLG